MLLVPFSTLHYFGRGVRSHVNFNAPSAWQFNSFTHRWKPKAD